MEEKKVKVSRENWDYLVDKLQYILADYLHGGESDEVIAKFENLLEIDNPEEKKLNFLPFNLEAAKAGKPVYTRDGRKARIICFDRKGDICPIIALVEENGMEVTKSYDENGRANYKNADNYDLMMLPEKKEMWMNIYKGFTGYISGGGLYDTKKEAKDAVKDDKSYVTTTKVYWEE